MKANFCADESVAALQILRHETEPHQANGKVSTIVSRHTRAIQRYRKIQKGERNLVKHKAIITIVGLVISCSITVFAQTPEFNIIKPSTTGVPGEEVRVMKVLCKS